MKSKTKLNILRGILALVVAVYAVTGWLAIFWSTRLLLNAQTYADVPVALLAFAAVVLWTTYLFQDGALPRSLEILIAWARELRARYGNPQWRQLEPDEQVRDTDECSSWANQNDIPLPHFIQLPSGTAGWISARGLSVFKAHQVSMAFRRRVS